jgi:hypothetical protein
MLQKKMHPAKKLGAAPRKKKGKIGPTAVLLRNLRKLAAYHCQTIIFTTVEKTSDKAKHAAIEEVFYGNVSKNIISACQQLVAGDHEFSVLYNTNEGDEGNVLCLNLRAVVRIHRPIMFPGETLHRKCWKPSVMESHSKVAPFGRWQIRCWHR